MAKLQFYPIDVTYKIVESKPVIELWSRLKTGERAVIIDRNFEPYFYVFVQKGEDLNVLKQDLLRLKFDVKDSKGNITGRAEITKVEASQKLLLSKKINALKITVNEPSAVHVLREEVMRKQGVEQAIEADIPYARRYIIDKKIIPLCLCEAECSEIAYKAKVPALEAIDVRQVSEETMTEPRILAFDIETYNPLGKGVVPEEHPILMIALAGNNFHKVVTWKRFRTELDYVEIVDSEADMIERFKQLLEFYKPEIITGYFSDGFDFPYLKARAKKYKIDLDLGLDYTELEVERRASQAARIRGIPHFDVFQFIRATIGQSLDTDSYKLDAVAEELLGEKKEDIDIELLAPTWDDAAKNLDEFCKYNLKDAQLTLELANKLMVNLIELMKIVGLSIDDISRIRVSQLVEWYLIKRAPEFNELAPNKPDHHQIQQRRMHSYKGAFVYEPRPGFYTDIVIFDFRSLYPSIISAHNIGPGTLNCECCKDTAELVPADKAEPVKEYWFCKNKKGFIPSLIEELILRRARIKEAMNAEGRKLGAEQKMLDARQNSLKLLANAFYGYLGFFAARWYSLESAEAVTSYGRFYIKKVIYEATNAGFEVIYSDTDSVFLNLGHKTEQDALKFSEMINLQMPKLMELGYDGYYPAGIFVFLKSGIEERYGAKKKYALLSSHGNIIIKGFETVRRNWSFIAKDVQKEVLNIVLKEKNPEKALEYARSMIKDIKENKVPVEKMIIFTQLQKETDMYDAVGPHVAVARKMAEKGIPVGAGSIIKFVITKPKSSKERIRDRAKFPEEVAQKDYDSDYYINNQILPSIERIFNVLGYAKEDLIYKQDQSKLDRFFK